MWFFVCHLFSFASWGLLLQSLPNSLSRENSKSIQIENVVRTSAIGCLFQAVTGSVRGKGVDEMNRQGQASGRHTVITTVMPFVQGGDKYRSACHKRKVMISNHVLHTFKKLQERP